MSIYKFSLSNGLNVYIKKDTRAPIVLSQIWYKVGSSYEYDNLTGISHMLEHMMFKGTDKYSKDDLNSIVENNGGVQNAFTSNDYTAYYQFWHKKNLELSLSIESSRMCDLIFDQNEFDPEKKVVLEERSLRTDDKAFSYAYEQFMKLANKDNSRSTPIIGWRNDIENYTLENLKNWYKTNYSPNNASIVIVGDINPHDAFESVKKYFDHIPAIEKVEPKIEPSLLNIGYRHETIRKKPNDIDAVLMGYIVPSMTVKFNNNDPFALMILNSILGSADASILQQKMVREENLCCFVDSEYTPFTKGEELFLVSAVANEDENISDIQTKIENIIENLKIDGVTKEQLTRAKVTIKADKIFSMDSIETQANLIGSLASIDLDVNYYKYIEKLYDVTTGDINRVLNTYFNKKNLTSLHLLKD